ncbi:MAG: hypothetical protein R2824_15010 [Saprospiraceae bacterium]|nr:hypothetical protein [Lewinella sp.]
MSILLKAKLIAIVLAVIYLLWKVFFTSMKPEMSDKEINKAKVSFSTEGRGGNVFYRGEEGSFSMYWEFGGGNVIAIIDVPSAKQWEVRTQIPLDKRMDILNYIGKRTVAVQTTDGKGSYVIRDNCIEIKGG